MPKAQRPELKALFELPPSDAISYLEKRVLRLVGIGMKPWIMPTVVPSQLLKLHAWIYCKISVSH